jgi:hypothetical protein
MSRLLMYRYHFLMSTGVTAADAKAGVFGPLAETANGRLAMLALVCVLYTEVGTCFALVSLRLLSFHVTGISVCVLYTEVGTGFALVSLRLLSFRFAFENKCGPVFRFWGWIAV